MKTRSYIIALTMTAALSWTGPVACTDRKRQSLNPHGRLGPNCGSLHRTLHCHR